MPTLRRQPTAVARLPLFIADGARQFGLEPDQLLRDAGFRSRELQDPDARVPVSKLGRLWALIAGRVPDPAVGLLIGEAREERNLGLVAYTARFSPTLGDALQRLVRYSQVVVEDWVVSLRRQDDRVVLTLERGFSFNPIRPPVDFRLTAVLTGARKLTGVTIDPLEARFPYPAPASLAAQQRVFRCPLIFDASHPQLVLRVEDLALPIPTRDTTLLSYLDRLADEALRELTQEDSFTHAVQRALWHELSSGAPSIDRVASRLGVSGRSLQRRLAEEGTSFSVELDRFRRDMAQRLLRENDVAIYEVAYLLGYADPSAFHRAFRRWHGASPRHFRAGSRGRGAPDGVA